MISSSVFAVVAVFAGAIGSSLAQAQENTQPALAHTREEFSFVVQAPFDQVFPLFGAYEERKWATAFDPQFVYPSSPHHQQGMVFTTVQDGLARVWANTAFDAATGHVQYVYWIADTMVAQIDIHIENRGARDTHVSVVYERTSLRIEANELVVRMAHADAHSGKHWAEMINGYLERSRK
jgi:hypothetical protein